MPYIIKVRKVRAYVTNFYKKNNEYSISFHKHISKAKFWKTENGVRNALLKFINSSNYNIEDFMIVEKSNSELGIFDSTKSSIPYRKPKIIKQKKKNVNIQDIKIYMKSFFKYIKRWYKINILMG